MKATTFLFRRPLLIRLTLILVFLLAVTLRFYWMSQKEMPYGDELTSVCLAYNHPGWGAYTYDTAVTYQGDSLRNSFFSDQATGWTGVWEDLRTLHTDNRDLSHASLYYMALRVALWGSHTLQDVLWQGFALNLLFFALSFWLLALLLIRLFPGRYLWVSAILACVFWNPATVANTLLLREYQLAETCFVAWTCFTALLFRRLQGGTSLVRPSLMLSGALLAAAVCSTGYFNALYPVLTLLCIVLYAWRVHAFRNWPFFVGIALLCPLFCYLAYQGFFNFLTDVRTVEVAGKMQGEGFFRNLYDTLFACAYILTLRGFTPVWIAGGLAACLYLLFRKRPLQVGISLPRLYVALWGSAVLWILAILYLATWKFTRYISPALPVFLAGVFSLLLSYCRRVGRRYTVFLFAAFLIYAFWDYPMEYLERRNSRFWPEQTSCVYLYAPDAEAGNSLNLLVPYLGDRQQCRLFTTPEQLFSFTAGSDTLWVVGGSEDASLRSWPGFLEERFFNGWQSFYLYTPHNP